MIKDKSIFIKNIYYMLSYAFRTLEKSDIENIETEKFDNIHNLLAAILGKGIGQQIKHGLYRKYKNITDDLSVVRGKINMSGTINNRINHNRQLTCEYDEFTENNLLNQILKTTVMLLLGHSEVDSEYKNDLRKEMMFFSNVDIIDPKLIPWTSIRFRRNNKTYRMLISICRLIIEGLLLTTDKGEYKLDTFVDDQNMSRLYERFIFEYYDKEFPQIKVTASQIPWALDYGKGGMLPIMQSDIMLEYRDVILIIDAKYYSKNTQRRYETYKIHSNNLYQIFTYVKNKESQLEGKQYEVSGMLLYARTDEAIQPNNSYHMSGNKISVKTLDLNKKFSEIAGQLDDVVRDHFCIIEEKRK